MQGALFPSAPVLDAPAARAERDNGIARVDAHAHPDFASAADAAVYAAAKIHPEFVVDVVWAHMPVDGPRTHDARAMGAAILRAVKAGWIVGTDRYQPSAQRACHSNPRRVWKSQLWSEA